jgi:hypothetical protein
VEVALALGVAAFCLLAIFGLLPTGLTSNQASVQQTVAAGIASEVVADLRSTPSCLTTTGTFSPRFGILIPGPAGESTMPPAQPLSSGSNTKFFSAAGGVIDNLTTSGTAAIYRATVGFLPPVTTGSSRAATMARVLVTWPALADTDGTKWPQKFTGSFETITALDRN